MLTQMSIHPALYQRGFSSLERPGLTEGNNILESPRFLGYSLNRLAEFTRRILQVSKDDVEKSERATRHS